jgi:hypothetical protein
MEHLHKVKQVENRCRLKRDLGIHNVRLFWGCLDVRNIWDTLKTLGIIVIMEINPWSLEDIAYCHSKAEF